MLFESSGVSLGIKSKQVMKIHLTTKSSKSVLNDLKTNNVPFLKISNYLLVVEDSPKVQMTIRLAKERFGSNNILVNN